MRKKASHLLCMMILIGTVTVHANVYDLDPIVVTAQRMEGRELETPAAVKIITAKNMDDTGARNLYEALRFTPGLYMTSFGAGGMDFGNHDTQINMRGFDRGAIILLNGSPIALNGTSPLSSLDKDNIEKIEIVKGAGSVLYGAEAMTGIVNVITKSAGNVHSNSVNINLGLGSRGNQDFHVGYVAPHLQVGYSKQYIGGVLPTTPIDYKRKIGKAENPSYLSYGHRKKSTRDNIFLNWNINKNWTGYFNHSHTESVWGKTSIHPDLNKKKIGTYDGYWDVKANYAGLRYMQDKSKVSFFYVDKKSHYRQEFLSGDVKLSNSDYRARRFGMDGQRKWLFRNNADSLIVGINWERETYHGLGKNALNHDGRNQYGVYAQYSWQITDHYKNIFGIRHQWLSDSRSSQKVWIPQWQQVYQISSNKSIYTNVGKSFQMPKISEYYNAKVASDLKPESGWNYELGYKINNEKDSWRMAIYYIKFNDKIKRERESRIAPLKVYNLGQFINRGIELEYNHLINQKLSWYAGMSYSNPQSRESKSDKWTQVFPKWQSSFGLQYHSNKWNTGLQATMIAKRPEGIEKLIDVSAHVGYQFSETDSVSIDLYNILDRRDITRDSLTAPYYTDPFVLMLRYKKVFS